MRALRALLCLSLLTGCVTQSLGLAAGPPARRTSPDEIEFLDAPPDRPHEAIGVVHAHCRTSWLVSAFNCREDDLRALLRARAAELGAHAIVSTERTGFWQLEWSDVHLRGKAVRWLQPDGPPAPGTEPSGGASPAPAP